MLATLYNVFTDHIGRSQFSLANADLHIRANNAAALQGARLPSYVLDPMPDGGDGLENWLFLHQDIHHRLNTLLGVAGNDLTDVDFSKPEEAASWIWLHAQEHLQQATRLGITA